MAGYSAKNIPTANNFTGLAKVFKNTSNFKAEEGDIVVFNGNYGAGHGHTAIVTNGNYDGHLMQFESLDQNWYGHGANKNEVAQRIVHNYDFSMWFIRPYYKESSNSKNKSA
ncbi:CHAP domain-containing protein [Staphylococcus gallinarum]|uniref:CHAP domain-containing protein n=1 Tax=Staphylococcus gallinarum TaxID=1293 RepID=UPI001F54497F|nr:CHAP domain-containing protein [Staphylococcus gallinarum]